MIHWPRAQGLRQPTQRNRPGPNGIEPLEPRLMMDGDPTLTVAGDFTVTEGEQYEIVFRLSDTPSEDIVIHYELQDGTAHVYEDFHGPQRGKLRIPAGFPDAEFPFVKTTVDDGLPEPTEEFQFVVTNIENGALEDRVVPITITDNDEPCKLSGKIVILLEGTDALAADYVGKECLYTSADYLDDFDESLCEYGYTPIRCRTRAEFETAMSSGNVVGLVFAGHSAEGQLQCADDSLITGEELYERWLEFENPPLEFIVLSGCHSDAFYQSFVEQGRANTTPVLIDDAYVATWETYGLHTPDDNFYFEVWRDTGWAADRTKGLALFELIGYTVDELPLEDDPVVATREVLERALDTWVQANPMVPDPQVIKQNAQSAGNSEFGQLMQDGARALVDKEFWTKDIWKAESWGLD